jgi:hypothetical protein
MAGRYGIHEAYYDNDGEIWSCSEDPVRAEPPPHNTTQADSWALLHQALEDGQADAERWVKEKST